ncbi:LuxR C-terminal-related transcriptional regulator [Nocardioides sp. CPCC 205120]|uniref:helix-turn-helix transcriptional regulator n=1 Tax=Nocardioides sp. CPCC 205120 TaxID=3406462 RepID=UPI003B5054DD
MEAVGSSAVAATLDRGLARALRVTGVSVGFGGLVDADRRQFVISSLRGTRTNSLHGVTVRAGEGLGGKALAMARPATVADYHTARGITRRYDYAVVPEGLKPIVSLPVALPGDPPLAVLYLAERRDGEFGGRLHDRLRPALGRLAHELHVELEVARRVGEAGPLGAARSAGDAGAGDRAMDPGLHARLSALMASTTDVRTRDELARILAGPGGAGPAGLFDGPGEAGVLTPREADVVRGAGEGLSNARIAARLGLTEGTVKSYMKSAMAKLGAENRFHASLVARRRGLLG